MTEMSKENSFCAGTSSSATIFPTAPSPSISEHSALLDKEGASVGCSPAPSNCSVLSEQEPTDMGPNSRQSPFLSINQASPSNSYSFFPRPEGLNTSMPDSETSSRSSMDGISFSKNMFRKRKNSSDSDSSEGSGVTGGGESVDGDESNSRKNSRTRAADDNVIVPGRGADAPRGRIAHIRRESAIETEVAHECLVKVSQKVSTGFDEFVIDQNQKDLRKRTPSTTSVGEPITIVTNSFLPHSCSPSPTRLPDAHKQCYSPSTQQMVRPNIPYSPNPSPTQSPTRNRLLRSLSPSTSTRPLKRRYTPSCVVEDTDVKRNFLRNSTSPLVTDSTFPYPTTSQPQEFVQPHMVSISPSPLNPSRKPFLFDSDYLRRTSLDSMSDDQKSVRDPDEISEPSSIQQCDQEESMDTEVSNEVDKSSSISDEKSTDDATESNSGMQDVELEAINAPLPDDDDDDL
ncbi:unnamed protein product [Auanema sp. JU1783]|nr:unnamed protein product [Auanema sp. JU1783]